MSVKVEVREGDTWGAIAARELGNETLGREIAGFNGQNETGAPTPGTEIRIPYRDEPTAAARECANCGAPMPGSAAYCSQCGARADGRGSVARKTTVPAGAADSAKPQGKLPDDFPGRDALAAAGIDTYAKLRKAGDVTEIAGIGDATAAKISEALEED